MKNRKTNRRPPSVKPAPAKKRVFLQNKSPAAHRASRPLRKKLPAAIGEAEPARKKGTFCKTNRQRPVVTPSPCGKKHFLRNKPPAAGRQTEPALTPAIAGIYHRTRG